MRDPQVSRWPRAPRWLLAALALVGGWASGGACTEGPAADKKEDPKPKITFSPEAEAKLAELVKKVAEAKRKMWGERMKKEIAEVAKVAGLASDGVKALEVPAQQAADLCLEGWSGKMDNIFRRWPGDRIVEIFEQILPEAEVYAQYEHVSDYVSPNEHAAWIGALQRTLTAEQAAAWEKAQAERKRVLGKEIDDFLAGSVERVREQYNPAILAQSAEINLALALPKERAEKLDALAKSAVDKTLDAWRISARKILFSVADEERRQMMKEGEFYIAPEENELPHKQAIWAEGLARLLSPDESKRLEVLREEHKTRRIRFMARTMVVELDKKIAFTENQRQRLQPIAERLVRDQPALFPEDGSEEYGDVAPRAFFAAGSKATEEEMKPILDAIQWRRWQDVCMPQSPKRNPAAGKSKPDVNANQPRPKPELEEVEHAISDLLYEKTARERKRVLNEMMLKAENAARVACLGADRSNRLQTAARGVTEALLEGWKSTTEHNVRAQARDMGPDNVKQLLAALKSSSSGLEGGAVPEKHALWERTVEAELTGPQRVAWQKEGEERTAYREKTILSAVTAEFDRKYLLTKEQAEKLAPIIAGIVKDYRLDLASCFSSSTPWYIQSHYAFVPFAGVPEKDLKAILTTNQWDRWAGSREFTNSAANWARVKNRREQRLQAAK